MSLVHKGIRYVRSVFGAVVGEHGLNVRTVEKSHTDIRVRDIEALRLPQSPVSSETRRVGTDASVDAISFGDTVSATTNFAA